MPKRSLAQAIDLVDVQECQPGAGPMAATQALAFPAAFPAVEALACGLFCGCRRRRVGGRCYERSASSSPPGPGFGVMDWLSPTVPDLDSLEYWNAHFVYLLRVADLEDRKSG